MTIEGFAFERLFAMPAIEGLKLLRGHLAANPGCSISDAIDILGRVELDARSFDFQASQALHGLIPAEVANDGVHFYRCCISHILLASQPVWTRTMLLGKGRFYATLERDEQSLFRQAGILNEPPLDDFVDWWDVLTGELRLLGDAERMSRGRAAERRTIELEIERLAKEGINERPHWTGLDDNTKGYDVTSYEWKDGKVVNKLIEVKSTIASPLRFRVTRNEWEQASRSGAAYIFHVWDLQKEPPILHVRTVEQVRPHIPSDNEKGKWKDAEIPVGGI